MNALDQSEIKKWDAGNMLGILESFPDQLEKAFAIGRGLSPKKGKPVQNVIVAGVGGSAIGAEVIRGYVQQTMICPMRISRSYTLPGYTNESTLLVVSSYSGNTEEALAAYEEGRKRKAQIFIISSGGEICARASKNGDACIPIPGGLPPRMAIGYSVIPVLLLFDKLGVNRFAPEDFHETLAVIREMKQSFAPSSGTNAAKDLAARLAGTFPVIYAAADHFEAVALRWRGQIEENAKMLASHHTIPEMNHNEIEGWGTGSEELKRFAAVFLRDAGEHPRVQLRIRYSAEIIKKSGARVEEAWSKGRSLLARSFSLIYLGDYTTFYLAILNQVDPSSIAVLQELKARLAKT